MKLYLCQLVSTKGYVKESFYREGKSAQSVLDGLNMLKWQGKNNRDQWKITDPNQSDDDYDCDDDYNDDEEE